MIEILASLVLVMLLIVYGAEKYADYQQELEWSSTATHATTFNEASKRYIADNTDFLLNETLPFRVTPSLLIEMGYLQNGFSSENNFGQSYVTGVVQNSKLNGKLEALTCSINGEAIPHKGVRTISAQIQGLGGYVSEDGIATGAFGVWQSNTNDFGLDCKTGHIAIAVSSDVLGTSMQESDRLYRFKVNGRPDLNRMHAAIDMNGNDLNNAGKGHFKEDIRTENGWLITQTGKGWINETHGGGFYMDDDDWIKSVNGKGILSSGQIKGGSVRSENRLSTGDVLGLDKVNVAGSPCKNTGDISRDAMGKILSCQEGVWKYYDALNAENCHWIDLPDQLNGHVGQKYQSCPVGYYVAGLSNYREGDWTRTGVFKIECCK